MMYRTLLASFIVLYSIFPGFLQAQRTLRAGKDTVAMQTEDKNHQKPIPGKTTYRLGITVKDHFSEKPLTGVWAENLTRDEVFSPIDTGYFEFSASEFDVIAFNKNGYIPQTFTVTLDFPKEVMLKIGVDFIYYEVPTPLSDRARKDYAALFEPADRDRDDEAFINPPQLVKGKIADQVTGEPLTDVRIVNLTQNTTRYSDKDGKFEFSAGKEDVMDFSHIGYLSASAIAHDGFPSEILLERNHERDNMGYYESSPEFNTAGFSSVSLTDLKKRGSLPMANPLQAFQGRVAGLIVEQLSGVPGSGYQLLLGGPHSLIDGGNDPLFIVDGVAYPMHSISSPVTSSQITPRASILNTLSPATIDRIVVLRDADATAIYGSRGGNGVILIFTKRNTTGKTTGVEINATSGFSQYQQRLQLLNTAQWLEMRNEAFRNDKSEMNNINARDLLLWDTTRNTDWQKKLLGKSAPMQHLQLHAYETEGITHVTFDADIYREGSVFPKEFKYSRRLFRINVHHTSYNDRLNFDFSASYSEDKNTNPMFDLTAQATSQPPLAPKPFNERWLNWENGTWLNPYAFLDKTYESKTTNVTWSGQVSYQLHPKLIARIPFGMTGIDLSELALNPISSFNPALYSQGISGIRIEGINQLSVINTDPHLEYTTSWSQGIFKAFGGMTFQRTRHDGSAAVGSGYFNDIMGDISLAPKLELTDVRQRLYIYNSAFLRLNYNWRSKYIINLTGTRDASDRFSNAGMRGNYGAVGIAWVFSQEPFMRSLPTLTFGKFRASYGYTGNDQIGEGYIAYYGRANNPELGAEVIRKMDIGMSLTFQHRVEAAVSIYSNVATRLVGTKNFPDSAELSKVLFNLPVTVRNSGLEFTLNAMLIDQGDLKIKLGANLTLPHNKLVRYDDLSTASSSYTIGESIESVRKFKTTVDPLTGNFQFADRDGNGVLDDKDKMVVALGIHRYGGAEATLQFRRLELNVLAQYVKQFRSSYIGLFLPAGLWSANQPVDVMRRWQKPGDRGGHRFIKDGEGFIEFNEAQSVGDIAFTDASFVRIKNITLSYRCNHKLLDLVKMRELRLYLQAQNLLTLTRYVGTDPESIYPNILPPLQTVSFGVNASF